MPNLLAQGEAWLGEQRHDQLSSPVTYHRGPESVSLQATAGRSEFDQQEEDGSLTRIEMQDFIVRAADLVIQGAVVEPKRGDLVKRTIGTKVHTFTVASIGVEPPFRYTGPERVDIRIHTKHTAEEDAP